MCLLYLTGMDDDKVMTARANLGWRKGLGKNPKAEALVCLKLHWLGWRVGWYLRGCMD